ncbi:MAG: porin [Methylophaga sp.]
MHSLKKIVLATMLGLVNLPANASELKLLVDMLHENGMVSDAQYQRLLTELAHKETATTTDLQNLKAELAAVKQQAAASEAELANLKQQTATDQQQLAEIKKQTDSGVEVTTRGGIGVKSRDGQFETRLRGRLMVDMADYDGEPQIADGTDIRRARLAWTGKIFGDWDFQLDYDFSDGGKLRDSFVAYTGFEQARLRVGLMEIPLGLQYRSSSSNSQLIERSLLGAFGGDRFIGVQADTKRQHWSAAAGVFGDDANEQREQNNEGWGIGSRLTAAPINGNNRVLHFGVASFHRHLNDMATLRFSEQPEARVAGFDIVDTGIIPGARTYTSTGVEWAAVRDRWSAQAEYMHTGVERTIGEDVGFAGWHLQSGFFLTDDSLNYANGDFGTPSPNKRVGDGGIGAWELVARYSSLDLTDEDIFGGEIDSLTFGVNWYPVPMLRFSANYINVLNVDGGPNDGQEPRIVLVRSQWAF